MRVYIAAPTEKYGETCGEAKRYFGENTEVFGCVSGNSIDCVKTLVDEVNRAEIILLGRGWRTDRECRVVSMLAMEYGVPTRWVI